MPGKNGVGNLGDHRIVESDDTREKRLARSELAQQDGAHLIPDAYTPVDRLLQLA